MVLAIGGSFSSCLLLCGLPWVYMLTIMVWYIISIATNVHSFLCSCNISSLCKGCLHRGNGLTNKVNWFCCCTEFVEGGFNEDSGKWRQDNSLCETTAPNSVKNGLVVACLVFALAVTMEWISCLLLMRCALVPSSDRKYIQLPTVMISINVHS